MAKKGIVSFHHGDNRWNRGGPPAFWEVYLRKPSTGFIIQVLTEELDGGRIIFRGDVPTRRSYTENIVDLYRESNPSMANLIIEFATKNHLPVPEENIPFGGAILKVPSFGQSIIYLLRTAWLFISLLFNRIILRKRQRWNVAYYRGSWRDAILGKGVKIANQPNHYFADPFVIKRDGRTICYVEDYDYKSKKGCIAAIEIHDKGYKIHGPVLEEEFHMSFPYIFEYNNDLYMIPDTSQSNSIRLYKCVIFPFKWKYQKDILNNVSAADSMVFEYDGRWWLLTNIATAGNKDHCSQLFGYYNSNPLSDEWNSHEQKPLIFDSNFGRNGGLIGVESNHPVRVRQKQSFNLYGSGLSFARITKLSPNAFKEDEIGQINPNFFPNIEGCHHIHSNYEYTVYDFARTERIK